MATAIKELPQALHQKGLETQLAKVCKKHNIVFMAIFGSFVRGKQTPKSDVDIAIEFEKTKKKSLIDLLQVENELSKLFNKKVDLGIFSSLSPYVIDDVKKEMHIIYEQR